MCEEELIVSVMDLTRFGIGGQLVHELQLPSYQGPKRVGPPHGCAALQEQDVQTVAVPCVGLLVDAHRTGIVRVHLGGYGHGAQERTSLLHRATYQSQGKPCTDQQPQEEKPTDGDMDTYKERGPRDPGRGLGLVACSEGGQGDGQYGLRRCPQGCPREHHGECDGTDEPGPACGEPGLLAHRPPIAGERDGQTRMGLKEKGEGVHGSRRAFGTDELQEGIDLLRVQLLAVQEEGEQFLG